MQEEQLRRLVLQLGVGAAVLLSRIPANTVKNRPNKEPEKEINFSPCYLPDFKVFVLKWGFHFLVCMIGLCTVNKKNPFFLFPSEGGLSI